MLLCKNVPNGSGEKYYDKWLLFMHISEVQTKRLKMCMSESFQALSDYLLEGNWKEKLPPFNFFYFYFFFFTRFYFFCS